MAHVRFEPAGVEVRVEPGSRLLDVTDRHPEARVPYSCRAATCATCRVEVMEGEPHLAMPGPDEADMLDLLGNEPRIRLCCQLVLAGEGRVVLRVVDPD